MAARDHRVVAAFLAVMLGLLLGGAALGWTPIRTEAAGPLVVVCDSVAPLPVEDPPAIRSCAPSCRAAAPWATCTGGRLRCASSTDRRQHRRRPSTRLPGASPPSGALPTRSPSTALPTLYCPPSVRRSSVDARGAREDASGTRPGTRARAFLAGRRAHPARTPPPIREPATGSGRFARELPHPVET